MTAGAAAAAVAIANAIKASGAIVHLEPIDFARILALSPEPLVVHAFGRVATSLFSWPAMHQYLTSYKGLFFYTRTKTPFPIPKNVELIESKRIWIPS